MPLSIRRLFAAGAAMALTCGAVGGLWDLVRFGASDTGMRTRIERDVRAALASRAAALAALTAASESLAATVDGLDDERDQQPVLFERLAAITGTQARAASLTLYRPDGHPLAWSDGPAEDLPVERLRGAPPLVVTSGTLGVRLVHVRPLRIGARLVATAVAEQVLSAAPVAGLQPRPIFETAYGAVEFVPPAMSSAADKLARPTAFLVTDADGAPLVEVRFDPATAVASRGAFRRRVAAIAGLPLAITLLLASGVVLDRRRRARSHLAFGLGTLILMSLVVAGSVAVLALVRLGGWGAAMIWPVAGFGALGLAAVGPVSAWLRRGPRHHQPAIAAFARDHVAAGLLAGLSIAGLTALLRWRLGPDALPPWQFALFPMSAARLGTQAGVLLAVIAALWAAGTVVAAAAERWRVQGLTRRGLVAAAWWSAGALISWSVAARLQRLPVPDGLLAALLPLVLTILFGWFGANWRRAYRRATPSARLAWLYAALVIPTLGAYPLAAHVDDAAARHVIAANYAPEVRRAEEPQHLREELLHAQDEIDAFVGLDALVNAPQQAPTEAAYAVWTRTRLARLRTTSSIELYDAAGALVSRFALNVPAYGQAGLVAPAAACRWSAPLGEAGRFGADERRMLRGERALCDPSTGAIRGAIVVHLIPDYRALPFIATDDPYDDVLRPGAPPRGSRVADLQVAVYGWGLLPTFTSGHLAWPITPSLAARLTTSRSPFWARLEAEGRQYDVFFSNDRGGIYALGRPVPPAFEHLTRLGEWTALAALLFVALLLGATVCGPVVRRGHAPLRLLIIDVRTSFYRKLFLSFVLAAVGPVVALAFVFGTYLAGTFRADIESEATTVVTVARRVFEEISALQQAGPTDDLLVWIGQAIRQDVNLFSGARLVATSQRDLFDSGLLPTRTPAAVYRAIALDRLPSYTGDDRLEGTSYLVAAAPIPGRGRGTILSVPLALRQRELTHELDELNRGLLVGAALVVGLVAMLGVYVAGRVSTPVSRLTRATRQIAAGRLDVRIAADTADELRRLVDDFNTMAATLAAQRDELARSQQLKAWAEMARQVAHEIKNPLTPIQLSTEHLQRVHADRGRPLGPVFDQCTDTILRQVRLLRQIAGEFSNYAAAPTPVLAAVDLVALVGDIAAVYRAGGGAAAIAIDLAPGLPHVTADATLLSRAVTNLVENARQAMPSGGTVRVSATVTGGRVALVVADTGVGMEPAAQARAFEPYFSTKTAGSGLGLPNAKRYVEVGGGSITIASAPGQGTAVTITLPVAPPDAA